MDAGQSSKDESAERAWSPVIQWSNVAHSCDRSVSTMMSSANAGGTGIFAKRWTRCDTGFLPKRIRGREPARQWTGMRAPKGLHKFKTRWINQESLPKGENRVCR